MVTLNGRTDSFLTKQKERRGRFEQGPNFFGFRFLRETGSEVNCSGKGEGEAAGLVERNPGSKEPVQE